MINEKLILETLANQVQRSAELQYAIAGLTAVIESRLPDLSPSQKETLQNCIEEQKKDSKALKAEAEILRQAARRLGT